VVTLRAPAESNGFVNGHRMLHNRFLPSIGKGDGLSLDQLVSMGGVDLDLGQAWEGDAELSLADSPWDELHSILPVHEIIGGYYREVGTTFDGGELIVDRSRAV
jgi:hypothetical protein